MENELITIIGSVFFAEEVHVHETFLQNHWLQALYGFIGYNIYVLIKHKNELDTDSSGFISPKEVGFYFKKEWLGMLFGIWAVPIGVVVIPYIWVLFTKEVEFFDWAYIAAGPFGAFLQWYVSKKFNGGSK